jgi:hypothetical protein
VDFIPSEEYTREQAEKAAREARFVVELALKIVA